MRRSRNLGSWLAVLVAGAIFPLGSARADDWAPDVQGIIQKMRQLKERKWDRPQSPRRGQQGSETPQEPQQETPQESPEEIRRDQLVTQACKANDRKDIAGALQLAIQADAIRSTPEMRLFIRRLRAVLTVQQAWRLENSGNYAEALALYRKALAAWDGVFGPKGKHHVEVVARELAGQTYSKRFLKDMTDCDAAEKARLEQVRPQADALTAQGGTLLTKGDYAQALEKSKQALALVPNDPRASVVYWLATANLGFLHGDLDQTISALQSAAKLEPKNESTKHALNLALDLRKKAKQSVQSALPAVTRGAKTPGPAYDTGLADPRVTAYASLPRQAEAIVHSPGFREAQRGFLAIAHHDWPLASAYYRAALLKDPDNEALKRMVDLTTYMVERKKQVPQVPPASPVKPTVTDVLRILEQSKGPGVPRAALQKMGKVLDDLYVKEANEGIARDSAKQAAAELRAGMRKEALEDLRAAEALAPWVPNYRRAIDALTAPPAEEPPAGGKQRAPLDFSSD